MFPRLRPGTAKKKGFGKAETTACLVGEAEDEELDRGRQADRHDGRTMDRDTDGGANFVFVYSIGAVCGFMFIRLWFRSNQASKRDSQQTSRTAGQQVPEDSEILEVESWNPEVLNALIFHHSSESQSIIKKMFQ